MTLYVYVTKDPVLPFERIGDLHGKKFSMLQSQFVSDEVNRAIEEGLIETGYANDYREMLTLLERGVIDGLIGASTIVDHQLEKHKLSDKIVALPEILQRNHNWMQISKTSKTAQELNAVEAINTALQEMKQENIFEQIAEKYGYSNIVIFDES